MNASSRLVLSIAIFAWLVPALASADTASSSKTELQRLIEEKVGVVTSGELAVKVADAKLTTSPPPTGDDLALAQKDAILARDQLARARAELESLSKIAREQSTTKIDGLGVFAIVAGVVFVVVVVGTLMYLRAKSQGPEEEGTTRVRLARDITTGAMTFIVLVSVVTLLAAGVNASVPPHDREKTVLFFDIAKWVLGTVLPVVGAWVGGVMAFYFGKDNFKTGVDLVQKLTAQQKLESLKANDEKVGLDMTIGKVASFSTPGELKSANLKEVEQAYKKDDVTYERLPILDGAGRPLACLHRSVLNDYLRTLSDEDKKDSSKMTFGEFESVMKWSPATSFAVVRPTDTLTLVQVRINAGPKCKDVFVTEDGSAGKPALRWITNDDITKVIQA